MRQKLLTVGFASQILSMFISSISRYVKELTHYSRRVGHEVPVVLAVLCDVGWVGKGKRDIFCNTHLKTFSCF